LTMAAAAVTFGLALLEPTVAQRDTPEARAPVATAT
jgi:hypothetical protein